MKKMFTYVIIVLVINIVFSHTLPAQFIKGQVVNYQNEPIPYTSIFIKELSMGTSTNEKGYFEIKVPEGTYTCSFQHLSYEAATQTIHIPSSGDIIIKLIDRVYDLPMASVGSKQENPAYDMMRKAIGMAPYYMNQLNKYHADVYIKGTLIVEKISGLIKAMAGTELKEMEIKVGDKYLQESMNEIEYDQGKYHQTVKSISNTFPDQMNVELGMANYNIYNPENKGGIISPLSPQALSYYNFTYEGFSAEGKYIVNKIKVEPKYKNAMTFTGYLYISDGYWNVHRFELSSENIGIKATNRQVYGELEDNVWMPISNNMDVSISMLGNKAAATYVSSIKYKSYVVNPQSKGKFTVTIPMDTEQTVSQKNVSKKSQELAQQIEEIMNKSDMSNRDAYRISRLMRKKEKEDAKLLPDSLKNKNPLDLSDRYKLIVDKDAKKRDSIYWNETRPVPLMSDEVKSYKIRDSIRAGKTQPDSLKKKKGVGDIIMGLMIWNSYKIDSTTSFIYEGLLNPSFLRYNIVDGVSYKQAIGLRKQFKDTTNLRISFSGEYAFSRKRFMFGASVSYGYWPEKQGHISVEGGVKTSDFNYISGLPRLDNEISTLFFRKNFNNYFENRYVSISNSFEIINGLKSDIGLSYHSRKELENTSNYSLFYKKSRDFRPNIPVQNPYVAADNSLVNDRKAAIIGISLTYTPQQYYSKYGRTKYSVRSNYPTFSFMWRKGIKGIFDSESDFDQFELSVQQHFNLGSMRSFRYNATAGWFPNNKNMHFRDFRHFNIKEFELLFSPFDRSYNTLETYMPSTNEWYASTSAQYTSPYLLLKHLPLLNRTMIQENLYFSYLATPYLKNYTEFGYGLSNIWLLGSLGTFIGFEKFEYSNWGFKVSFNLSGFY
ncbi:MAG: DUF5686 and carboxypeptidase regulatory-like domain-containing protein [Prevotellaceae bacterium]|jgi:hypothetical protein|nr:DUF5686 and carboxypeptidase regulatory-like domain-containing protein [Prevotellaceae bacterium]